MSAIEVKANAKINLSLDVVRKRPDGYHDLKMIMQSVTLCDDIRIELNNRREFAARSNLRYLPGDERNLAVKAARAFFDFTGDGKAGAFIGISKRIPVCAGLGGGSSDAAAVLKGLNDLTGAGLALNKLSEIALTLGSDVPFCLAGGTALAEGRGEILTPLGDFPRCHIVIAKPDFPIPTPELFARLDCGAIKCRPDTDGQLLAINAGDLAEAGRRCFNVFESVLPRVYGEVREIERELLDNGARCACMSGTGPSVFGIFLTEADARSALDAVSGGKRKAFLCKPSPAEPR
jgi:4-diphosphocytidyl-2-C-methyl-D-erythritol kinase